MNVNCAAECSDRCVLWDLHPSFIHSWTAPGFYLQSRLLQLHLAGCCVLTTGSFLLQIDFVLHIRSGGCKSCALKSLTQIPCNNLKTFFSVLFPFLVFSLLNGLFSMDGGDKEFLETVSRLGCEIHCFDPSSSDASGGCPGNSLASNCGDRGRVSKHKMWLEWRAQKRRGRKARGDLGRVSRTLANIMAALGHHTVRGAPSRKQAHSHRRRGKIERKHCQTNIPWSLSPQHTQKALLLWCCHSNRALRHLWLL